MYKVRCYRTVRLVAVVSLAICCGAICPRRNVNSIETCNEDVNDAYNNQRASSLTTIYVLNCSGDDATFHICIPDRGCASGMWLSDGDYQMYQYSVTSPWGSGEFGIQWYDLDGHPIGEENVMNLDGGVTAVFWLTPGEGEGEKDVGPGLREPSEFEAVAVVSAGQ